MVGAASNRSKSSLITARRNFLGELLVFWLARRGLWKAFHSVRFRAAAPLPAPPGQLSQPVIFYANHNTWWDGYLAHIVTRQVYGLEGYLMMDRRQLERFHFFRWAGVFSVDQENGREALRSLEYIAGELRKGNGRALWIFPQGDICPQERRPLGFHSGLARLIRRVGPCYVYPVAVRHEFFKQPQPEFLISVGPARYFPADQTENPHILTAELEAALLSELDRLKADVNALRLSDFVTIIKGQHNGGSVMGKFTGWLRKLSLKKAGK
jgi:1-acyl-sn-glycerol-3-phosphate acyltransferase